jgi:SAM-dependent methyltransferase
VLARWSGWGAIPHIFDDNDERLAAERAELRRLLGTEAAWAQARRTTLNAHYTSATVVQAVWGAAAALGATGPVRVLEPGCGSGNFLGFAPADARLTGVELDETTAAVAQHLYGAMAQIHVGPFEDLRVEDGAYDLVIGNVPFARVTPHDPRHNRGRHALHNYFLVKSLHLARPGALVLALTSRYTLDARNSSARRELASLADLVGAVRLPERAFARSSGTDVVVDLLVLRRRPPGAEPTGPPWARVEPVDLEREDGADDPPLEVNEYFTAHPDRVLGRLAAARGMYRDHELTVLPTGDLDAQLQAALDAVVADAKHRGLTFVPAARQPEQPRPARAPAQGDFDLTHAQDGSFVVNRRGDVAQLAGGVAVRYEPRVANHRPELARLAGLRDAARTVLAVQVAGATDDDLRGVQATLRERYRDYVRIYGPINRSTQARTGRRDSDTGAEIRRRVRPRMGGFRKDPDWPLVAALEIFDEDTQEARPAAIFHERVIGPPHERHGVDTAD